MNPVLPYYAALLASARLAPEAERVLALAAREDDPDLSFDFRRHDVATWIAEPQRGIALGRQLLTDHPQAVQTLTDLVVRLAYLKEFGEAERYLARLDEADADGKWAYFARLVVLSIEGNLDEPGARSAAFGDPRTTDYARGFVNFMLNDVESGAAAWKSVDPEAFRTLVLRTFMYESLLPYTVRNDKRYKASLEDLGVGESWTRFMREKSSELEPKFVALGNGVQSGL